MSFNVNLPVTVGGVGVAQPTANLVAFKTVIVTGLTGTIIIEASGDGINFNTAASFTSGMPAGQQSILVACAAMRVNATNGSAVSVEVIAEESLARSGVIPTPPPNGPGAALDISDFGSVSTVFVTNHSGSGLQFDGSVNIEVSADGINWATAFQSFQGSGLLTRNIAARFVRAVGVGATADVAIASEEALSQSITSPALVFVFRPGGVQGANVYTVWADLMAAVGSVEGLKIIEFDDSLDICQIPEGEWDMTDVGWTGFAPRTDVPVAEVFVLEGALLPGFRMITGSVLVTCEATVTPPVSDIAGFTVFSMGGRLDDGISVLQCSGGAPFIDVPDETALRFNLNGELNAGFIGTNPPIRLGTVNSELQIVQYPWGIIGPDVADAPLGSSVTFDLGGNAPIGNVQTTILGDFAIRNPRARPRFLANPAGVNIGTAPVPSTVAIVDPLQTGACLLFDTTAADVDQELPDILTSYVGSADTQYTGGHLMMVKNVVGANDVNVTPAAGNTIDGGGGPDVVAAGEGRIYWCDGVANWYIIARF